MAVQENENVFAIVTLLTRKLIIDRDPAFHHITTATMTDQKPAQADTVSQRIARGVMTTSLLDRC